MCVYVCVLSVYVFVCVLCVSVGHQTQARLCDPLAVHSVRLDCGVMRGLELWCHLCARHGVLVLLPWVSKTRGWRTHS